MPPLLQNDARVIHPHSAASGARLVSVDGRELPLRAVEVSAAAEGGLARTELCQHFANPHAQPLRLTYRFPLPAAGAVAGYEIRAGRRTIRGEIAPREEARERFERAMLEGRTAGILDEERPNLFTQELGNVPAGAEVTVRLTIDQPLRWLDGGMWEWRFPTVAAPRYLGDAGRVPDAERVELGVSTSPLSVQATLELRIADAIEAPTSPSHELRCTEDRVGLATGAALDRDLVVRWRVAARRTGLSLRRSRPAEGAPGADSAYGLLTIVPPAVPAATLPRDVIVLLDTSGSMSGTPLQKAKALVATLIDSLTDADRLELIAFSSRPQRWRESAAAADATARADARHWLESQRAGGGTEMVSALQDALRPLREEGQRQVLLVTDGLIGFEGEAVRAIAEGLPPGSRLHAVGVGSAPNDAFTRTAARAGRGVEILCALDEGVTEAARRLIAATRGPVVVDLTLRGEALEDFAPDRPRDLMAGEPVLLGLRLRPAGGDLVVRGRTAEGEWEQRLDVPATPHGTGIPSVAALFGRERVEDLEMRRACGASTKEIDAAVEATGLTFGIATRLTSWVAIAEEPDVDPRLPVHVERIPQGLPYGMSAEALGLAAPTGGFALGGSENLLMAKQVRRLDAMEMPARFAEIREDYQWSFRPSDPVAPGSVELLPSPDGKSTIVQFTLRGTLEWSPGSHVDVVAGKGAGRFEIVHARTTRPGRILTGSLVRLAIDVPLERLQAVSQIRMTRADGSLWVLDLK